MNKQEREKLREEFQHAGMPIVIALLDHIDALEGIVTNLAAPIYSDEKAFALTRHLHRGNPNWAAEQLHGFALRAKAAIASAPEVPNAKHD